MVISKLLMEIFNIFRKRLTERNLKILLIFYFNDILIYFLGDFYTEEKLLRNQQ